MTHKILAVPFADVYPLYVQKAQRKGRTEAEVREIIRWLTGFSEQDLEQHITAGSSFQELFDAATLHPSAALIGGSVCGVKVQEVPDPTMRKVRMLDKLIDELAKGKAMEKILRG
ncbi:DUF2200 domain-containing protein [Corynebacterium kozikiae]|uniref:DUF2200 domain-containing protein n=1 Tax=Corynebacterium kozikiae TaxID=2968469 RepID=UPI00211CF659|nr:DUF2200 domain-containing protein [Corynebacterium sp. 76QC2CO]MCQ9344274.1 DUF2200 domain-containing protein [Corynebacterium sp. 76QC2CO]